MQHYILDCVVKTLLEFILLVSAMSWPLMKMKLRQLTLTPSSFVIVGNSCWYETAIYLVVGPLMIV